MAGEFKGLHVVFEGDTSPLESALKKIDSGARATQRNLTAINRALKFNPGNTTLLAQKMTALSQHIDKAKDRLKLLRQTEEEVGRANMSTEAWDRLQREIIETESKIKTFTAQYSAALIEMNAANSALGRAGRLVTDFGDRIHEGSQKVARFGDAYTRSVTTGMVVGGALAVKAAVDIDTALTDVRKTVDGTEADYARLKDAAVEFSKTNAVSADQMLSIEALGAQLGFSIDELQQFGEVVSGMSIATDMGAEQAATEMAQFANITRMAHSDIDNYASSIVALGNSTATTESAISAMAQRIAAAGTQVGMTQADILGVSAAMSSLGIEAEAGGTALSTTLSQIDVAVSTNGANLQQWADLAGMSVDSFKQAWGKNATATFEQIVQGMSKVEENGGNLSTVLESLGITGIRQTDVIKRLAGNYDLLDSSIKTANDGWSKNSALSNEVANRNESLAAKYQILKNQVVAVAQQVGGPLADALLEAVDGMKPLFDAIADGAESFANMSDGEQQAILKSLAFVAAIGPLASAAGRLGASVKGVGEGMTALSKVFAKIGASASSGTGALGWMGGSLSKVTGLSAGASLGLAGLAAAALSVGAALAVNAYNDYVTHMRNMDAATRGLTDSFGAMGDIASSASGSTVKSMAEVRSESERIAESTAKMVQGWQESWTSLQGGKAQLDGYISTIQRLTDGHKLNAQEQRELTMAVEGYNSVTGESVSVVDAENGKISESTEKLQENAQAWYDNARAKAYQDQAAEMVTKQIDLETQLAEAQATRAEHQRLYDEQSQISAQAAQGYAIALQEDDKAIADIEKQLASATTAQEEFAKRSTEANGALTDFVLKAPALSGALSDAGLSAADFSAYLAAMGEDVDSFSQKTPKMQQLTVNAFKNISQVAQMLGTDTETLSSKLAEAGVSSDKLAGISAESFHRMYESCNGNVDEMIKLIAEYNETDITDKDVEITDNDTTKRVTDDVLTLEATNIAKKLFETSDSGSTKAKQGEVDHLSKTGVNSKNFATTDGGTTKAKQGEVNTLKNTNIPDKSFKVTAVDKATGVIDGIKRALSSIVDKSVTITEKHVTTRSAAGSFAIPKHADGGFGNVGSGNFAIATSATLTDAGWVGEDGWEAIVPLKNMKYMRPFAQAVAASMTTQSEQTLKSIDRRIARLESNLGQTIAQNAPVIVQSEREFARRVREAL